MFALAEECRKVWKSTLVNRQCQINVDGKAKFTFPFQEKWDFQNDNAILIEIVPRLARAGEDLSTSVFEQKCDDGPNEIGQTIPEIRWTDETTSAHEAAKRGTSIYPPFACSTMCPLGSDKKGRS
jgi:hypothetical protein